MRRDRAGAASELATQTRASERLLPYGAHGSRDGAHGDRHRVLAGRQALGRAHEPGDHAHIPSAGQDRRARRWVLHRGPVRGRSARCLGLGARPRADHRGLDGWIRGDDAGSRRRCGRLRSGTGDLLGHDARDPEGLEHGTIRALHRALLRRIGRALHHVRVPALRHEHEPRTHARLGTARGDARARFGSISSRRSQECFSRPRHIRGSDATVGSSARRCTTRVRHRASSATTATAAPPQHRSKSEGGFKSCFVL